MSRSFAAESLSPETFRRVRAFLGASSSTAAVAKRELIEAGLDALGVDDPKAEAEPTVAELADIDGELVELPDEIVDELPDDEAEEGDA